MIEFSLVAASRWCASRRRIDHGTIPVFDQLAVAHAECVEREDFVERAGCRGRILTEVLVNDRHEIALRHDDLEWIALRRLRSICSTTTRSCACACARTATARWSTET